MRGLPVDDVGALDRARAQLLAEEPTLSFVFEAVCMGHQTQADVGRRLGVTQQHTSRLMYRAIAQLRAWMTTPPSSSEQEASS